MPKTQNYSLPETEEFIVENIGDDEEQWVNVEMTFSSKLETEYNQDTKTFAIQLIWYADEVEFYKENFTASTKIEFNRLYKQVLADAQSQKELGAIILDYSNELADISKDLGYNWAMGGGLLEDEEEIEYCAECGGDIEYDECSCEDEDGEEEY